MSIAITTTPHRYGPAGHRSPGREPTGKVILGPWATPPAPLRLTRRGRLVLTLLALGGLAAAVLAGVLVLSPSALAGAPDAGTRPATASVVVLPGQSLWEIAERVAPGADPRETVSRIQQLNGLRGGAVQAGQRLLVPAAGP